MNYQPYCLRFSLFACLLLSLSMMILAACASPAALTLSDARATAEVAGCWPGNGQTPLPLTVTPRGGFVASPDIALPTPTALPTTTPYPRCTPEPAQPTLMPYPTPGPTQAPYPTRAPFVGDGTEQATILFHLSETVLQVDIATHPSENWPAVIAVAAPLVANDEPRVFVRVFNPQAQRWGTAQSLGSAGSGLARTRFRTAQIAITGDGSVIAVWGIVNHPLHGILMSTSHDYGETWSVPAPIVATVTHGVRDIAATPDGNIAVLAISAIQPQHPILIRRSADGIWHSPEIIPIPAWYGSDGALLLLGEGDAMQVVVTTTGGGGNSADNTLFLSHRTWDAGEWQTERRSIPSLDEHSADILTHLDAIRIGERSMVVSFSMLGRNRIYGLTTLDAGESWGEPQVIAQTEGIFPPYLALAADPASERTIVFWTCCKDATFVGTESSHYTTWGNPTRGDWHPAPGNLGIPFVTGAIAAADTASAQAPNSQQLWLAWVEQVHQVQVRAVNLDTVTR